MEITKKINGKEYGFKFTLLTLKKFCEYKDIELGEFQDAINSNFIDGINTLLRAGYDVYNKGEKQLNEYEMDELIMSMSDNDLADIYTTYVQGIEGLINKLTIKPVKEEKKN